MNRCSQSCSCSTSCNAGRKFPPDNSVGMDSKRKDLLIDSKYKKITQEYANGTLKNSMNAQVNSPQETKEIAALATGQSWNDKLKQKHDRYGFRK